MQLFLLFSINIVSNLATSQWWRLPLSEEPCLASQWILSSQSRTAELSLANFCALLTYLDAPSSRATFTSSSQLTGREKQWPSSEFWPSSKFNFDCVQSSIYQFYLLLIFSDVLVVARIFLNHQSWTIPKCLRHTIKIALIMFPTGRWNLFSLGLLSKIY